MADTKTVDGGALEAEMVFRAGADQMTVLAHAPRATRRVTQEIAGRYGASVILDTILDGDIDPGGLLETRPPQEVWLALHAPSDARVAGASGDEHIRRAQQRAAEGYRVSLAGGIGRTNLEMALATGSEVLVIGSGVTGVADPEEESAWIRERTARGERSVGGR